MPAAATLAMRSPQPAPGRLWQLLFPVAVGAIAGAGLGLDSASDGGPQLRLSTASLQVLVAACGLALLVAATGWISRRAARRQMPPVRLPAFYTWDALASLPLLASLSGAVGVSWLAPQRTLLLSVFLVAKLGAWVAAMGAGRRREFLQSENWLAVLFFLSGFAALIYQIVWERALFAAFGVNIESVTLVVALFLFGLGLGAVAGAALARRFPARLPVLFLLCEAGVGLFGLFSLGLIARVAALTLHASLAGIAAAIFALLCLPTMLMGATLPILVSHLQQHLAHLGRSVGMLYCINTLGSALACFLTADVLFVYWGRRGAIVAAVACNGVVGILVSRYASGVAHRAPVGMAAPQAEPASSVAPRAGRAWLLAIAAATGFLSLSQEMVWMRLMGLLSGGAPTVFAHVLGCFLLGVAVGAWWGSRWSRRAPAEVVGFTLAMAAIAFYGSIAAIAALIVPHAGWAVPLVYAAVALPALLLGGVLTVLCHHAARASEAAGVTVAKVYVANILGATLGPLLTGFVWMQVAGLDRIILDLSVAGALLAAAALLRRPRRPAWALACLATAAVFGLGHNRMYGDLVARLQLRSAYRPQSGVLVKQTRSGIILVQPAADHQGDFIYGGGMYDGRFNVDPVADSNGITRAFMIAGLHPAPAEVLEIGLSSASWTRVMADDPRVAHLTTVEINAGYASLLRDHGQRFWPQSSVLGDPKVVIAADDGRRWLQRHPVRFDLIVQNTTWHWRGETANLLSREYFELCRAHLKPGGVLYLNTTFSDDVTYTAARVFAHIVRVGDFIAASDLPIGLPPARIAANLRAYTDAGQPVFGGADPARRAALDAVVARLASNPFTDVAPAMRQRRDLFLITDDNMANEYKRDLDGGEPLAAWRIPRRSWRFLLTRAWR